MIYLVGISHDYQWIWESLRSDYSTALPEELRRLLYGVVAVHSPTLIAEEFHESFREELKVTDLIGESVARRFGLQHLMCEPDRKKKWVLGESGVRYKHRDSISDVTPVKEWHMAAKYDLLRDNIRRERYWFKKLSKLLPFHKNVIFICGSNHLYSFKKRLEKKRQGMNRLKAKIVWRVGGLEDNLPIWRA